MNQLITTQPFEIAVDKHCPHCDHRMISTDNFCGECGSDCREVVGIVNTVAVSFPASQPLNDTTAEIKRAKTNAVDCVLNNPTAVIGLVVLLGPLGLLALWFSQRFNTSTKIITTGVYVLLTILLPIAVIWYWMDYSMRPLLEAFAQ